MQGHMNPLMTLASADIWARCIQNIPKECFQVVPDCICWHPPSHLQPLSVEKGLRHVPTVQQESAKSHPQPHYLPSCFEPGKVQSLTQLQFMQTYLRWLRSTSLPLPPCQLICLWPSTFHCMHIVHTIVLHPDIMLWDGTQSWIYLVGMLSRGRSTF